VTMRNANKSSKIPVPLYNGEINGKVMRNPEFCIWIITKS